MTPQNTTIYEASDNNDRSMDNTHNIVKKLKGNVNPRKASSITKDNSNCKWYQRIAS